MDFNELKDFLTQESKRECWCDDPEFTPNDYAGGNIDDAYAGGRDDSRALLARELLKKLVEESWDPPV